MKPLSSIDGPESDALWSQERVLQLRADPLLIKQWIMGFLPEVRPQAAFMFLSMWDPKRHGLSDNVIRNVVVAVCRAPYGLVAWDHSQIKQLATNVHLGAPTLKFLLTLPHHPISLAHKDGLLLQAIKNKSTDVVRLCMADPDIRFPPLAPARLEAAEHLIQESRFFASHERLRHLARPPLKLSEGMKELFPNPTAKERKHAHFEELFWVLCPPNKEPLSLKEHGLALAQACFKNLAHNALWMLLDTDRISLPLAVRVWRQSPVQTKGKNEMLGRVFLNWQEEKNPRAHELIDAIIQQADPTTSFQHFPQEMQVLLEQKMLQKAVLPALEEKSNTKRPSRKI